MKLTLTHPAAVAGIPVFVDSAGRHVPSKDAIRALRRMCDMSADQFGELLGISGRTVTGWEQGRPVAAASLWQIYNKLGAHAGGTFKKPKASK